MHTSCSCVVFVLCLWGCPFDFYLECDAIFGLIFAWVSTCRLRGVLSILSVSTCSSLLVLNHIQSGCVTALMPFFDLWLLRLSEYTCVFHCYTIVVGSADNDVSVANTCRDLVPPGCFVHGFVPLPDVAEHLGLVIPPMRMRCLQNTLVLHSTQLRAARLFYYVERDSIAHGEWCILVATASR